MINVIKNIDPIWKTDEYDVVFVGTNTYCILSNGFQGKIRSKYPIVDDANWNTIRADKNKLGKTLEVQVPNGPTIVLCYIIHNPQKRGEIIDYWALEWCLKQMEMFYVGKKAMTTLLGSSKWDGRGDRDKIFEIFNKTIKDLDLDVYDYYQRDVRDERDDVIKRIKEIAEQDAEKAEAMKSKINDIYHSLYLRKAYVSPRDDIKEYFNKIKQYKLKHK